MTIYDTRLRLGLPPARDDEGTKVVVVKLGDLQAGYIIDLSFEPGPKKVARDKGSYSRCLAVV